MGRLKRGVEALVSHKAMPILMAAEPVGYEADTSWFKCHPIWRGEFKEHFDK